jgi:hypothetical protein
VDGTDGGRGRAVKIDWSRTSLTVEVVTASWANRSIRPNPEYQRGLRWKRRQQQLLIDSVFRYYPLPRFYFQLTISQDPLGTVTTSFDILDGLQRIITMTEFREDLWPLLEPDKLPLPPGVKKQPCPWGGLTFSGLPKALQEQFLSLELPIVLIDEVDTPDEVRDLFIRLQAGTPLTTQQVRDAWPGNISPYVEILAGKLNRQGRFQRLFAAIDRRGTGARDDADLIDLAMDARQVCAQLLCLFTAVEAGQAYPGLGTRALDDLYHQNTEFDRTGPQAAQFEELLGGCQAVIVDRRPPGMSKRAVRKNRLFSLFLFLRDLRNGPVSFDLAFPKIAERFWSDDGDADEPKGGRVISPTTISENASWFRKTKMNGLIFPELDARRLFSQEQRVEIWARYAGKCGICGQLLHFGDEEYDHIVPWISGGRTEPENGRPVHRACHSRGVGALSGR